MTRGSAGLQSASSRASVSRGTTVLVSGTDGGPVGQPLRLGAGTWRVYAALLGADGGPAHWAGQNAWSVSLRLSVGIGAANYVETHAMRPSGTVITRAADYLQVQVVVASALGSPARIVLAASQPIAGAAPTWVTTLHTIVPPTANLIVPIPAGSTDVEVVADGLSGITWRAQAAIIGKVTGLSGVHRAPGTADEVQIFTTAGIPLPMALIWGFPA